MKLFKEVPNDELVDLLVPDEGELIMIYGAIGSGKTYAATADVMEELKRGQVVYTTWPIDVSAFDERESFWHTFWKFFFFRKRYFRYPAENWHYLDVYADDIWDKLQSINNAKIYFDDCIIELFDSYEGTKFSKPKRQWAFTTRHYDRTIVLVTQRPMQVQLSLRSQVNRFYKCEKKMTWPWLILRKYEYQDMAGETVDETKDPVSVKTYFAKKSIMQAYQSKYLREDFESSQKVYADAWDYNFVGRFVLLCRNVARAAAKQFKAKRP